MTQTCDPDHTGHMLEIGPEGEVPAPAVAAALLAMDVLHTESVPMWAACWLVQGYDGESLAELAGLSRRDTYATRDLLPAALADAGITALPSKQAAIKIAYDHVASVHVGGRAHWRWAIGQVQTLVFANNYEPEVFEHPLGALWAYDDELGEPWARTESQLAKDVHQVCLDQLQTAGSTDG